MGGASAPPGGASAPRGASHRRALNPPRLRAAKASASSLECSMDYDSEASALKVQWITTLRLRPLAIDGLSGLAAKASAISVKRSMDYDSTASALSVRWVMRSRR